MTSKFKTFELTRKKSTSTRWPLTLNSPASSPKAMWPKSLFPKSNFTKNFLPTSMSGSKSTSVPVGDLILQISLERAADQVAARGDRAVERSVRRQIARDVVGSERGDAEVVERLQEPRNVAGGDLDLRPEGVDVALRSQVGVERELSSRGLDAAVSDVQPAVRQHDLGPRVRGLQVLVDRLVDPHVENHLALVDHRAKRCASPPPLARSSTGTVVLPADRRSEERLRVQKRAPHVQGDDHLLRRRRKPG